MRKTPLLFKREGNYVIPELNPAAAWVSEEPTIAHRKYDGICMLRSGTSEWFFRKDVGWIPVKEGSFYEQWKEAVCQSPLDCDIMDDRNGTYESGTYELVGPKINGNPEGTKQHRLMPHNRAQQLGDIQMLDLHLAESVQQMYDDLKRVLFYLPIEGVVFKDIEMSRQAKLRRKDFDFSKEELNARIQESKQRQGGVLSELLNR